jgi:hypothetical protein
VVFVRETVASSVGKCDGNEISLLKNSPVELVDEEKHQMLLNQEFGSSKPPNS